MSSSDYQKLLKSSAFEDNNEFFKVLPEAKDGDWLYEYDEEHQSFNSYKRTAPDLHSKESTIYLLTIVEETTINKSNENMSSYNSPFPCQQIVNEVADYIRLFVDVGTSRIKEVNVLPERKLLPIFNSEKRKEMNIPESFKCEVMHSRRKRKIFKKVGCRKPCYDHADVQVNATDILKMIGCMKPKDAYDLVGITNFDLFDVPPTLFISGFASRSVAIQSYARYDPYYLEKRIDCEYDTPLNFFEDKQKPIDVNERRKKIILLSVKTVSHEIMHNFGLGHCIKFSCLMNGSGNLEEDLAAPYFLCPLCLKKLLHFSRFRCPVERYKGLLRFFKKYDMNEEVSWLERRIQYIEEKDMNSGEEKNEDDDDEYVDVFDVDEDIVIKKKRKLD